MSNIDIVLGLFLGFGIVQGFLKGFIWGVTSLIAVFVALWGAIHFSAMVAPFISDIFSFFCQDRAGIGFYHYLSHCPCFGRAGGEAPDKDFRERLLRLP